MILLLILIRSRQLLFRRLFLARLLQPSKCSEIEKHLSQQQQQQQQNLFDGFFLLAVVSSSIVAFRLFISSARLGLTTNTTTTTTTYEPPAGVCAEPELLPPTASCHTCSNSCNLKKVEIKQISLTRRRRRRRRQRKTHFLADAA
jgi:hypothetical protein